MMRALKRRLRSGRDERGAVAVLVGALVVLLLVSSSFVMDLGQAYVAKRKMQTAADAAALAAASAYATTPGACSTMLNTPANATAASTAANSFRSDNGSTDTSAPSASCDATTGTLRVTVTSETTTSSIFGQLTGIGNSIGVKRTATAAVSVSPEGVGLRPMAICLSQIANPMTTTVQRIDYPKVASQGLAGCPDTSPSGNWWTVDCPEVSNASSTVLNEKIRNGCDDPVNIAQPQTTTSEVALSNSLKADCPSRSSSCLSGNPGNTNSSGWFDAWQYLVDERKTVILPVFCAPRPPSNPTASNPAEYCNPTTVVGTGTNAIFPVYRLAAVRICGYYFGKQAGKKYQVTDGECANPPILVSGLNTNDDNFLLLAFKGVQTSGGTGSFNCNLGGHCDLGVRRTGLVN